MRQPKRLGLQVFVVPFLVLKYVENVVWSIPEIRQNDFW